MRVLLVEDEDSIAEPLADGLRREGHEVERVADGASAIAAQTPDIVLLDLRLPDIDGYAVCRQLRERSQVPIIMITARGEEIDKVLGLELGADDYLVKPFGFRELLARIGAVMRRQGEGSSPRSQAADSIVVGDLTVDTRAHLVCLGEREIDLTPVEFALLADLASHAGAVRTRAQLLADVWHTSWTASAKTVDVHVAALRRKLGDPAWIVTVRGVGYRLSDRS